jgi:small subunit ribosomal protein S3
MIERTFIKKNYKRMELENYLTKTLSRAGFSHLEIIKTPLVTRIVLHVAKPGLAIGKSGSTIKQLTEVISKEYEIDNPQIEIQEIKQPNLNAKIVVERMASTINRGFSWRSVSFRTIRDIMNSGAQGVELVFKGALGAKGARKRKQRIVIGYMKKIGDQAKFVDKAKASANPKIGAIGIKLRIIHPNVIFPDKIDVKKVVEEAKKIKEEKKEQEENEKTKQEENKNDGKTKEQQEKTKEEKIKTTEKNKEKQEVKKDDDKQNTKETIEQKQNGKKQENEKTKEEKIKTTEKNKEKKDDKEEKK